MVLEQAAAPFSAAALSRADCQASAYRLPELFCGFDRDSTGAPVAYPVACSPQAWAAGAPLMLIRTMLGLRADASAGQLTLDKPVRKPLSIVIRAELGAGAAPFQERPHDLTRREATLAEVTWQVIPNRKAAGRQTLRSPDIAPILRELVGVAGWTPRAPSYS